MHNGINFNDFLDALNCETSGVNYPTSAECKKLGGLQDMTTEEVEQFQESREYKEYKADFTETSNVALNMQGRTVQEIMGLSDRKKTTPLSYNSLEHYDIDIDIYQDIADNSSVMQKTLEEGEKLLPTFKYLHQDIFLSLYKYKAVVLPETSIHASTRMNRNILNRLINTPEYISLRQACRLDMFNAAFGTEIIGREALEILKEVMNKVKDLEKKKQAMDDLLQKEAEIDDLMDEMQDIEELMKQASRQGDAQQLAKLSQDLSATEMSITQARALADKIAQECDDLVDRSDDLAKQISQVMAPALSHAGNEVAEVSKLCAAWGLGEGEKCHVAFQNKRDAVERIRSSKKLPKLTDMIGRFKESAITEQKKKAKHGAVEIKSVTTGNKIQDALPSDRMNLCNSVTKKDFYRRYSEHGLLQYSKESSKQKNKGPIIVCVDTSGSMSGDREIWSKALTVGVLEIAQMQKRDFACILYSGHADEPIIIRKDEVAPEKIIDCAETFHAGGTNFQKPLEKAMKLINDSTFKDADILFLTDGDCSIGYDFFCKYKKIKEEKEFKTLGVLIDLGRGHCSSKTLEDFCDNITFVSDVADLSDSNSVANKAIFGTL